MILEVGKKYKTRAGNIAVVTAATNTEEHFVADHFKFDLKTRFDWFIHNPDGGAKEDGSESEHDIVSEITEGNH